MPGPDDAIVLQFEESYDLLFQQLMSRLRQFVRVRSGITGSMAAFGLLGPTEMQDITGERHGLSQWTDSPSYRRWAVKQDFISQQILDQEDRMEILVDLEMGYLRNAVSAAQRKIDEVTIDNITAPAYTGRNGTTTSPFNTAAPTVDGGGGNQIALGVPGTDGLGDALHLDKMRLARAVFDSREVGLDEIDQGQSNFVWVTNGKGHSDLLKQTQATSSDYIGISYSGGREESSRMPLVQGRIPYMLGFRIKIVNQLNLLGVDFINLAWHRDAVGLAIWNERLIRVGELPEHRYSTGVTVKENFGATRIQDAGVLAIVCKS